MDHISDTRRISILGFVGILPDEQDQGEGDDDRVKLEWM